MSTASHRATAPGWRGAALHAHRGVAVWTAGPARAAFDVWFHPAFGDSHLSYREAFASVLASQARVFVHDPPGHGASPPLPRGLTITEAVRVWRDLIAHFSGAQRLVLVGHSMAGIIASRTAAVLERPPALVVGVEANLTTADAYFSGLAARFAEPREFHASLRSRMLRIARHDPVIRRFACSLQFADPLTLWTLGRSVFALKDPGAAFRRLRCPKIHYWDRVSSTEAAKTYVARHRLPNRELERTGHWPMIKSAAAFYRAIAEDSCGEGGAHAEALGARAVT